jgi:probable phosphoglycerate mutase
MKDIFVVAHTQSQHHVDGLVGGWFDTGLTELGRRQARRVAERIASLVGAAEIELRSSDLMRAHQTAEAISARLGVAIQATDDLRELSYGEAGGKPQSWLEGKEIFPPRNGDRLDTRFGVPGAETKREFLTRIYRATDAAIESPVATQVIVTHGYSMTFVVARWIGLPIANAGHVNFASKPGGITHLREDDVRTNRAVLFLNDTAHMAAP